MFRATHTAFRVHTSHQGMSECSVQDRRPKYSCHGMQSAKGGGMRGGATCTGSRTDSGMCGMCVVASNRVMLTY